MMIESRKGRGHLLGFPTPIRSIGECSRLRRRRRGSVRIRNPSRLAGSSRPGCIGIAHAMQLPSISRLSQFSPYYDDSGITLSYVGVTSNITASLGGQLGNVPPFRGGIRNPCHGKRHGTSGR
ncbi:hypothetical protein BO78DRAFT_74038 [Aspergillus sclerotiicarbonarius CBS 121057]|uniref:Uncharacterized protein n=1 Tax=Aspergillus sclerotiicarbonarius (strain CBS 121057 / IBT 28362) TaxID=1448318 RepID=A0A319F0K5_ASPSB|nr:hypothetical protein BO78DRAFT_74038 [Aspergillus sclerotiicarbonarius CBS 121057]